MAEDEQVPIRYFPPSCEKELASGDSISDLPSDSRTCYFLLSIFGCSAADVGPVAWGDGATNIGRCGC